MRSDRKQTILFIIILLVMSMGIGYAFLTTTLTIDGTSDIDSSSWDVHFENVQVQSGSVTGSQVTTPATISADGQTVSYHIKLNEPGDQYVFTVDIVNEGTLDAYIENVLFKINGSEATNYPDYLAGGFYFDNYDMTTIGKLLEASDTTTLTNYVFYREDLNPEDLPDENESLTITIQLVFSQAGKPSYVYYIENHSNLYIGESLPTGVTVYNSYEEATNSLEETMFIRLQLRNNRVFEKTVGVYYNNNLYYLRAGHYDENVEVFGQMFPGGDCGYSVEVSSYICHGNNITCTATFNSVGCDSGSYGCFAGFNYASCGE